MSLTLEQFAAQAECCRMTCVAGFGGLQREVNSFSIIDTPEIVSWLRGGELVVDAGFITASHPELLKTLVPELARRGCAGLGVKLHRYFDVVPPQLIEDGDRLDFPIFELPYEIRFSDLAYEIHKHVFEQRLTEAQRISDVYARLVYTISTHQDAERTLYDISGILHNPVLLVNDQYELIAFENPAENTAALADFFPLSFGSPLFGADALEELERCRRQGERFRELTLSARDRTLSAVAAAIRTGERLWGFLIVPACMTPIENAQYRMLESICPLMALHFAWGGLQGGGLQEAGSEFAGKVLLAGDTPPATVQYLCTVNGFDYTRRRICLNIAPEHFEALSFSRRSTVRDLLRTECGRLAGRHGLQSYPVFFSSYFTVFLLAAPQVTAQELTAAARSIAEELAALLARYEVQACIGIGDCSIEPEKISSSFRRSVDCIRLGKQLAPEQTVYPFDEYQIYYLLSSTMKESELRALYHDTVEPLREFDRVNGCGYMAALEAYLRNRFNVTKTAAEIHVHRNTMIYQLDRIRELLPLDLDDCENVLKIQMGIHAMRLLEHPESGAAR